MPRGRNVMFPMLYCNGFHVSPFAMMKCRSRARPPNPPHMIGCSYSPAQCDGFIHHLCRTLDINHPAHNCIGNTLQMQCLHRHISRMPCLRFCCVFVRRRAIKVVLTGLWGSMLTVTAYYHVLRHLRDLSVDMASACYFKCERWDGPFYHQEHDWNKTWEVGNILQSSTAVRCQPWILPQVTCTGCEWCSMSFTNPGL